MEDDIKYYKKNCKSINTLTFGTVRDEVRRRIKKGSSSTSTLLFAEWLFHKLRIIWRASEEIYNELFDPIKCAIANCTVPTTRMQYINWNDVDYSPRFMHYFYLHRFDEVYFIEQMLNDSNLLKWNQNYLETEDLRRHFIKWIETVSTYEQRSNLLDVLLRFFPKDNEVQEIYVKLMGGKTLYDNEQNVHDDDIHISVLKAVKELYCWFKDNPLVYSPSSQLTREQWLRGKLRDCDRLVKDGIFSRLAIDKTVFEFKDDYITKKLDAFEILFLLVNFILSQDEPASSSMMESLAIEMRDALELCITGYVARFMNAIQGYTEFFQFKIPFRKQLHAKVSHDISKEMFKLKESSNVILGTYDEEYAKEYYDFIIQVISLPKLNEQYGSVDVCKYLPSILDTITGKTIWSIEDGKILYKISEE